MDRHELIDKVISPNLVISLLQILKQGLHMLTIHLRIILSAVRIVRTGGRGGPRGEGGCWGPPTPFWGPQNVIKREKTLRACTFIRHVLVLNSYPDPPFSEILYLPLWRRD